MPCKSYDLEGIANITHKIINKFVNYNTAASCNEMISRSRYMLLEDVTTSFDLKSFCRR